jgi:hypothetical protein
LTTDQLAAKDEEKIDTDPTEAVATIRQREAENPGVIDNNDDDGKRAEKIQPGLPLTISKARVDCGLTHGFIDAECSRHSLNSPMNCWSRMQRFTTANPSFGGSAACFEPTASQGGQSGQQRAPALECGDASPLSTLNAQRPIFNAQ